MQVAQSGKLYSYLYKIVLCLISLFLIYNIITIFFISRYEEKALGSRVLSVVNVVESNLKHSSPKKLEEVVTLPPPDSPLAGQIKRTSIFVGPVQDVEIEMGREEQIVETVQYERVDTTDATKIDFKGVTGDLVLINVRRKIDEQWYEQGFPIKAGEQIGTEKIMGGRKINFTTNCILQGIISNAQKPVTIMKKVAVLNEEGEFVGTKMMPGETFMKSTAKIVYKDDQGSTEELWLGQTAVIIEEPPKEEAKWYEDPVGTVKSTYKDVTKTLKSSTKDESVAEDTKE